MKQFISALCLAATLAAPAAAAETPRAAATATPHSAVSMLHVLPTTTNGNRMLTRAAAVKPNVPPSTSPDYLTTEQVEASWQQALEKTFNIDHTP